MKNETSLNKFYKILQAFIKSKDNQMKTDE